MAVVAVMVGGGGGLDGEEGNKRQFKAGSRLLILPIMSYQVKLKIKYRFNKEKKKKAFQEYISEIRT